MMNTPNTAPSYSLADNRIQIFDTQMVVHDQQRTLFTDAQFEFISVLAAVRDTVVPYDDLCHQVFGRGVGKAYDVMRARTHIVRQKLGPELGHSKSGAIRVRDYGFVALSTLHHETANLSIADDRVTVNPVDQTIACDGVILPTHSPRTVKLLTMLAAQPDEVIGYPELCQTIWGRHDRSTKAILRVFIAQMRRELGHELGNPEQGAIRNVARVGYSAVSSLA